MDRREQGVTHIAEQSRPLGVVDSLSAGFDKVNGMLWVLLFPLAIGFFLWRGPQLSAAPALLSLVDWYTRITGSDPAAAQAAAGILSTNGDLREAVLSVAGDFNLFSFLSFGIGIAGRGAIASPPVSPEPLFLFLAPIGSPLRAVASVLGLQALGLLFGAAYLGLIAQRVRGETASLSRLLRRLWGYWLSLAGFLLFLAIAIFGAAIPVALLIGFAAAFVPAAADLVFTLVVAAWQIGVVWFVLFMFFVVDAAILAELGPFAAARASVRLVGRQFWSTVGFILIYIVISYGMMALWLQLGGEPWAIVVAIAGNAYISSGLAAASMVYYRARSNPV